MRIVLGANTQFPVLEKDFW